MGSAAGTFSELILSLLRAMLRPSEVRGSLVDRPFFAAVPAYDAAAADAAAHSSSLSDIGDIFVLNVVDWVMVEGVVGQ